MSLVTTDVSIIVPKESTNLITNPSFEIDATGYLAIGAGVSVASVTTQSRRGVRSCEVTTASNVASGVQLSYNVTSGVQYSFSVDVLDVLGQTFTLYVINVASQTIATTTWTGTGYWKRRYVTFTASGTETYRFTLSRSSVASTTKFYTDGWQLEVGAVSTYFDGSMLGFVVGQTAYRWNGLPNASSSWRSGQTRSGGTYMHINSTVGTSIVKVLSIIGLGMAPITNIALPSTLGGSDYQGTIANERPFTLVVEAHAQGDYAIIERAKAAIEAAIKPDLTTYDQPLLLQCDQLDANGLPIAETLMIPCLYESGLETDGSGDSYNEKFPVNFKMFLPLLQQEGEHGTALGYQTTVANANNVLMRDTSGVWQALSTGANAQVRTIVAGTDGSVFFGGDFTDLGTSSGDRIAKWNGTAWSALGTGLSSFPICAVIGPDGSLYVGGEFASAGGVANTSYIAKWNGSAWSALGTGMNGFVYALAVGTDGSIYAGGVFTSAGGVANTNGVAKWNGSSWVSVSSGIVGTIYAMTASKDGVIYAGGSFASINGTSANSIAKYNGSAWSALGAGVTGGQVLAIATGNDGSIYAGGAFTSAASVTNTAYIAKWNGVSWFPLGTGLNDLVNDITIGPDDNLYAAGAFSIAGGVSVPDYFAMWNGSVWMPLDVDLPGVAGVNKITFDKTGSLYAGYPSSGSATSATVTVPSVGTATAYPKVVFTGPGTVYQLKNYTTGKSIYFNLTLNAGEVATLNLDPESVSFTSTFRGNIMNTILPGSDMDWELLAGSNNVSCFIYGGTTAASGVIMTWRDQYWSVNGAVR